MLKTAIFLGLVAIAFSNFAAAQSNDDIYSGKIKFHPRKKERNYAPGPVNVSLYYESLCPDCQKTWLHQLFPTFEILKATGILNIMLVPYGNAKETQSGDKWVYTCQHGDAECIGNLIETCAMYYYYKQEQYLPFVHCLEYYGPTLENAQYCSSLSKMNYDTIVHCVNGDLGNSLEHQMALMTEALNPPHQYVPWFTLNGVHNDDIQNGLNTNMLSYVCNAYTGTKPKECIDKMYGACYKEN